MGKKDKRWVLQRKKDHYYNLAKRKNYRSRATYKLFQLNEKFEIIKENNVVVDLGCAPGVITSYSIHYTKLYDTEILHSYPYGILNICHHIRAPRNNFV